MADRATPLGFGAAFAVLLPGRMDKPFSYAFSSSPLWFPFWGLYGEFDRHDFEEYVEDEMPTRLISLVLMWLYMLITTIVLVNLLIAQMSETYAKEMEKATQSWLFERAQLVLEFKDAKASPLPPPLAPVYDLAVFLRNCIRRRPADERWSAEDIAAIGATAIERGADRRPRRGRGVRVEREERCF